MISESTVEENILLKAQQKRKLDQMVITQGKFSTESLFSSSTLQHAFGMKDTNPLDETNMEQFMKDFEDEEDQKAMTTLRLELEQEQQEFDEQDKLKDQSSSHDETSDFTKLAASLKKIDQYAFKIYDEGFSLDQRCGQQDFSEIESIASAISSEDEELNDDLIIASIAGTTSDNSSWYLHERKGRNRKRLLRSLKGESWKKVEIDGIWYWYNEDDGEWSFETPSIIRVREEYENACIRRYNCLPLYVLQTVFSFLHFLPDGLNASRCCARWRSAGHGSNWIHYVKAADNPNTSVEKVFPRVYQSLKLAIDAAQPGDTIVLSSGHHWEGLIEVQVPLKIIHEDDGSSVPCVLELTNPMLIMGSKLLVLGLVIRTQSCELAIQVKESRLWVSSAFLLV